MATSLKPGAHDRKLVHLDNYLSVHILLFEKHLKKKIKNLGNACGTGIFIRKI